ncbi:MAG: hypothetical protein ACT4PT_06900 [Methanobacteriota archaeon]
MTVFIPGATVAAAIWVVVTEAPAWTPVHQGLGALLANEWTFNIAFLVASAFFGTILASVSSMFEERILDDATARAVGIPRAQYDAQWYRYVDTLRPDQANAWVSRIFTYFLFELRMTFALLVLGLVVLSYYQNRIGAIVGVACYVTALLLGGSCLDSHRTLANFRKRNFAAGPP